MGSPHHSPERRTTRQEESRLRAETEAEQPPSDSEAPQRQPSPGSVERQRLVSPSSTARQRQGSSHDRDTHDGSLTAVEELDLTRRAQQRARETTLRRRQRLHQMQRDMEAAVATTRTGGCQPGRTGTGLRCSCDPAPPGARAGRQHAVGTTKGRRFFGRQRPVHSLFATRRVFRRVRGRGRRQGLRLSWSQSG